VRVLEGVAEAASVAVRVRVLEGVREAASVAVLVLVDDGATVRVSVAVRVADGWEAEVGVAAPEAGGVSVPPDVGLPGRKGFGPPDSPPGDVGSGGVEDGPPSD
jgi:hypothetical protein